MKRFLAPFFALFALCAAMAVASPQKQFAVTVRGLQEGASLADFPVLVRISQDLIGGFSYGDVAQGGADLRFSLPDGTLLDHEIDTWNTAGESLVWVKVPVLENGTEIIATYKDNEASSPLQESQSRVWSASGHIGVWHMNEDSGTVADSSMNGLAAVPMGDAAQSIAVSGGPIGKARQTALNAKGYLSVPVYDGFALGGNFTVSGWMRITANHSGYPRIFSRKNSYADNNGWEVEINSGKYDTVTARGCQATGVGAQFPSTMRDAWCHLAFVYSGNRLEIYFNGAKISSGNITAATDNGLPLSIGCNSNGSESFVPGEFDECRLHSASRDGGWIAAEYATAANGDFLLYGGVETLASDDALLVSGNPAKIGSPSPAYGLLSGLGQGENVSLAMPATIVPGEGSVTNVLDGWALYAIDTESLEARLVRSSSDPGEQPDRCNYVHGGYSRFEWIWSVRDAVSVSGPRLASSTENTATLAVPVNGTGYDGEGATLELHYGMSPSGLDMIMRHPAPVTGKGEYIFTADRLLPGRSYFAKGVVVAASGERRESGVVQFKTADPAIIEGGQNAGLWQAFFTSANADWTKDIKSLPEGTDWRQYTDQNRIRRRELLPIAAYLGGNPNTTKYLSEVWGDYVSWPVNGGQWVYSGYMWLERGKVYKFRTRIDDNELVALTDRESGVRTVLVEDRASGATAITSPNYIPSKTGWHEIEIRLSDGSGGAGGYDNSAGYKNTANLGYSSDGGSTWKILEDPGDGSLLAATLGSSITLEENASGGRQQSVLVKFLPDPALGQRSITVALDSSNKGDNPSDWRTHHVAATLPADASEYLFALPESWGEEDTVLKFFLDGNNPSEAFFWRDASYPAAKEVVYDGTGGDTVRVSVSGLAYEGENCEVRVLAGETPDSLDRLFLTGSVATGESIEVSAFAPKSDPRYLNPGSSYYFALELVSGGKVSRTIAQKAEMSFAASFISPAASANRRTITASVGVSNAGAGGVAVVELYGAGVNDESQFAKIGASTAISGAGTVSVAQTFPEFEKEYFFQFRAKSATAGGTAVLESKTAIFSARTADTTTYTWTGPAEGDWSDSANWSDNQEGDCAGYPQSASATVNFLSGTRAKIRFTEPLSVRMVYFNKTDLDIEFAQGGASTNATKLTAGGLDFKDGSHNRIVLDNVAVRTGNAITLGAESKIILDNGANLYCDNNLWVVKPGSAVELRKKSYLSCNEFALGGSALVIDDSEFAARNNSYIGHTAKGGYVRFEGAAPLYRMEGSSAVFRSALGSAETSLDFVVPAGGFAKAPLQGNSAATKAFGQDGSSPIAINVLDESPANFVSATITSPLISWPSKGIDTSKAAEGSLPKDMQQESDDSFVWDDSATPPKTLSVKITGSSHAGMVLVTGYPENVAAQLSPGYGYSPVAPGASLALSAPQGYVDVASGKRAVVEGWELYDVDSLTLERTLVSSGSGNSATCQGTGQWQELRWIWRIEYGITVNASANGSAAAQSLWVGDGEAARVTPAPAAGYAFGKWEGDVHHYDNKVEDLSFTVEGRPYEITPVFRKIVYISPEGSDSNGGTSPEDALKTVQAALGKDETPYIMALDGIYEITEQITIAKGATLKGLNPGAKAIFKAVGKISTGSIFRLEHDDAKLENIAITTAYASSGDFGRGVHIKARALVDSCVITNCRSHYVPFTGGGGVLMEGDGAVRRTVFDLNTTYASGGNNATGHSIFMTAGLVDRCRITRGGTRANPSSSVGGVYMQGGILRSSLVAGCSHGHENTYGTGVHVYGGTVENTTIAGNYHNSAPNTPGLFVEGNNKNIPVLVKNTIVWGNRNGGGEANWGGHASYPYILKNNCTRPAMRGDGNITDAPDFKDAQNGDYDINYCAVVDRGLYSPWMASSLDLAGRARKTGESADIGAYEFDTSNFSCGFDTSSTGALDEDTVRFTAKTVGTYSGELSYRWEYTDSNGNATVVEGSQYREFDAVVPAGLYSVSLTVTDSEGRTATLMKEDAVSIAPSVLYVRLDGGNVYPYNTVAGAATNLSHAIEAAQDGSEIRLGDGWHVLPDSASIAKGIKIVSENGPEKTTVYGKVSHNGVPLFFISNRDAVVSGITISGISQDGKTWPQQWGAIRITASGGTVTNCVVANHRTQVISIHGSGAHLEGGTVVDTIFTNNHTACSGGAGMRGGALYITGKNALVDRCRIVKNKVGDGGTSYGGGVYINNGIIRNSLLMGNYSVNYGGGLAIEGAGRAINLTIVRNTANTGNPGIWSGGGTIENTIVWNNITSEIADEIDNPGFVDADADDYNLEFASTAVDAGEETDYGCYDLDLKPRKSGSKVDLGCFEFDQSQFSLSIGYEKTGTFSDSPVILRAGATPSGVLEGAKCYWTIDGTEPGESNYAFEGAVVTNLFDPGTYTVRFKAAIGGVEHEETREDWLVVYGRTVYLKENNPNSRAPYATEETAATNLVDACAAAMDGATVLIDDGTYAVNSSISLSRAVKIVSKNGPGRATVDGNYSTRIFILDNPEAVLSGLRLYRGKTWSEGAALRIVGGTATNLVVDSCDAQAGRGSGVYLSGGLLVDSVITNCFVSQQNGQTAAGIFLNGDNAIADRCLVIGCTDNKTKTDGKWSGESNGAVFVQKGSIRSSVVTGNRTFLSAGIVLADDIAAKAVNCTVTENNANGANGIGGISAGAKSTVKNSLAMGNVNRSTGAASDAGGSEAAFSHCAVPGGYGSGSVSSGIRLLGRKPRPYDISVVSPLRDMGEVEPWMENAKDFYGRGRISGKSVDIGAGEQGGSAPLFYMLR